MDDNNQKRTEETPKDSILQDVDNNKRISTVAHDTTPSKLGIVYDVLILMLIGIDLTLIFIDNVLTSDPLNSLGEWLLKYDFDTLHNILIWYGLEPHKIISMILGFITIALISELFAKWFFAIINKTYYRWFFFPFVHWYEVIGCFPQLRVLRLLRAVVIGKRLYQMGYRFLPEKWLDTGKFYYTMVLEELSDRVLLTAISNIRTQISNSQDSQALVKRTIDNNRKNIESMILSMLQTELAPRLRKELIPEGESPIAKHVGLAVGEAIAQTPELHFILRKIPIAGSMIESQIMGISAKVGYNIAEAINKRLLNDEILDELFTSIAHGVSNIDTSNPALEAFVADIISESIDAFENQVKTQQWQHHKEMEQIQPL